MTSTARFDRIFKIVDTRLDVRNPTLAHVKSMKRYEALLSQYLQAVAKGRYTQIVWLCPTADLAARVQRIITSITSVSVGGKRVLLEDRHYRLLSFLDYSQWPIPPDKRELLSQIAN